MRNIDRFVHVDAAKATDQIFPLRKRGLDSPAHPPIARSWIPHAGHAGGWDDWRSMIPIVHAETRRADRSTHAGSASLQARSALESESPCRGDRQRAGGPKLRTERRG